MWYNQVNMDLNTPVSKLSRVGATTARRLSRLGIKSAADLLGWFPFRYEDYRNIFPISGLKDGVMATVRGRIDLIANKRSFKKRKFITEALISDATGSLRAVWFNQPFIAKNLKQGEIVFLSGKVKNDMLGVELVNPAYERAEAKDTSHTARLVPIYPLTEGLTQKQIRFLIKQTLPLTEKIVDWVPPSVLEEFDLAPLNAAFQGIHFPHDEKDLKASTDRLKFNELFLTQLQAERVRSGRKNLRSPKMTFKEKEIKNFVSSLPFALTRTQKISAWEILKDLEKNTPMNRLLSGDVGSGKTAVAAIALYNTVLNGYQAVFMAPTEILARQHYETLGKLLGNKVKIGVLSKSQAYSYQLPISNLQSISKPQFSKNKKNLIAQITKGKLEIIVGTHAMLSENIKFRDVGLVIVDEQHRFGVEQRKAIKDKTDNLSAHYLSMTATPIPRSLALMVYGDLDVSIISEMPPGRRPVITKLVEAANRAKAYEFIRNQVRYGRQVFVICPLIQKAEDKKAAEGIEIINYRYFSSNDDKKSVVSEFEKLSKEIFPDLRVGYLHGKMRPAEKEKAMEKFKNKEIDILVSTSVVEVGVDIPNASVMMIEDADRYGLAQLHQFRGRVGRSSHQSYCFIFTNSSQDKALRRLKYFENISNGFKLAEKDLETRGPGEVYGIVQSGMMNFRLAKLTDQEIIKKARQAAVAVCPQISGFPALENKMSSWEKTVHLE